MKKTNTILLILVMVVTTISFGQKLNLDGRVIGWTTINPTDEFQANAGLDYTFNIGNGLHVMGEGLYYILGEEPFQSEQEGILFSGIGLQFMVIFNC